MTWRTEYFEIFWNIPIETSDSYLKIYLKYRPPYDFVWKPVSKGRMEQ